MGLIALIAPQAFAQGSTGNNRINDLLETIRRKHKLPALAGAIVTSKGPIAIGAVGVRKNGTDIPVSIDDEWHLGSDTKAMTATLIGALIDKGKLQWETTLEQLYPNIATSMTPELRRVTILQLLSHRAGLPANLDWQSIPRTIPIREQRQMALKMANAIKLDSTPGTQYEYSNLGYVIAGVMAEKAVNSSWEEQMARTVFSPLGMSSASFGGTGTPGKIDQPWGHDAAGRPVSSNGPAMDNPPVMGPAGTIHCSLTDWAKFIADQLRGARGERALLKTETYKRLHTPPFGGDYALGWTVTERAWGGGRVLTHAGSNTMNFALVWMSP
jgi:CubicO group peptidase (beta-lactamase class C family)